MDNTDHDSILPPAGVQISPSSSSRSGPPSLVLRRISPNATVPLRHAVLWPHKPAAFVLLPEDDAGHHFGAFLDDSPDAEPVAVLSLFRERVPVDAEPIPDDRTGAHISPPPAPAVVPPSAGTSSGADANTHADTEVDAARFRKFACAPAHQGHGIGSALLAHAQAVARVELGCRIIWCDARAATAPWYERRGLTRFGPTFYKGDIEYVRMRGAL